MGICNKADLKRCKEFGEKWQNILGLQDWDILFRLPEDKSEKEWIKGYCARETISRNAMQVTVVLGELRPDEPLEETVLHELLHLTLRPMLTLAEARFNVDSEDLGYEEHRVIQRFVKLLLRKEKCE